MYKNMDVRLGDEIYRKRVPVLDEAYFGKHCELVGAVDGEVYRLRKETVDGLPSKVWYPVEKVEDIKNITESEQVEDMVKVELE